MARITVEDCLEKEENRFKLVLLAIERSKQLMRGAKPLIDDTENNKDVVIALREIAKGLITFDNIEETEREAEELRLAIKFKPRPPEETFELADLIRSEEDERLDEGQDRLNEENEDFKDDMAGMSLEGELYTSGIYDTEMAEGEIPEESSENEEEEEYDLNGDKPSYPEVKTQKTSTESPKRKRGRPPKKKVEEK